MKKTILLLALVAGAGYYLHWYTFSTTTEGNSEHVNIVIDKDKIKQDEAKAMQRLRGESGQMLENAARQTSYQAPAGQPPASQAPAASGYYGENQTTPPQYRQQGQNSPPRGYSAGPNQPAVQVVEQPPAQQGYPSAGGYAPEQDPYSLPDTPQPAAPRRPVRTAAQDLDRGFN